mgnify:FL=1
MLDQHPGNGQKNKLLAFVTLFVLGSLIAAVAELPYGGWFQIPLLSILWWRLSLFKNSSLKQYFLACLLFGIGYFVTGLWWLYISLHDIGGMNALLSCLAVFLLSAYVALYFSIACLPIRFFKTSYLSGPLLAASWVISEYLREVIFTGFPWVGFAETQVNGPFAAIAPFFGGLACTFLVIWTSWEIFQFKQRIRISIVSITALIALSQLAGLISFTKPFGEVISIRLIQGNFEQSLKFNPLAINQQIEFYASEIKSEAADLIIIPETAFALPQNNLPPGLMNYLQGFSNNSSSNLLLGLIGEVQTHQSLQYTNRAIGLSPYTSPYQYDKSHLVPFGEFIPPGFHWFVKAFNVPMSDFAKGSLTQEPFGIVRKDQPTCHQYWYYCSLRRRWKDTCCPSRIYSSKLACPGAALCW